MDIYGITCSLLDSGSKVSFIEEESLDDSTVRSYREVVEFVHRDTVDIVRVFAIEGIFEECTGNYARVTFFGISARVCAENHTLNLAVIEVRHKHVFSNELKDFVEIFLFT